MPPIIRMVNLTKKFGEFTAVDHLNLEVEEGEILGLLGPNGAGKTTTLLMLTTVIKPTEGTAFVGPYDVGQEPDKARTLIGMAFQEPKLLWVDSPWDILNWHAKVCGLSAEERKKKVRWVLEQVELWNDRLKSVHAFSGGMRKRVEIAKILIQRPKIAIVDEPTAQIDIVGKHRIWNMLRELRDEGSTILLATNELYEADVLSDRVAIMHKGKLLVCDEPKKLKDSIPGGDVVEIALEKDITTAALAKLKEIPRVVNVLTIKQNQLKIYLNQAEEVLPKITEFFMKERLQVKSIRMSEPSLDDVFAHYTGLTIEEAQRE
ncbi:MAG: ATP-binding cassette domain-containing protein [Candidatus Bathyarchaeota archaeon]|nr:ATP-binding cassette domain-containing protein [Candidatus Bathyarchaeota archaeon]